MALSCLNRVAWLLTVPSAEQRLSYRCSKQRPLESLPSQPSCAQGLLEVILSSGTRPVPATPAAAAAP